MMMRRELPQGSIEHWKYFERIDDDGIAVVLISLLWITMMKYEFLHCVAADDSTARRKQLHQIPVKKRSVSCHWSSSVC